MNYLILRFNIWIIKSIQRSDFALKLLTNCLYCDSACIDVQSWALRIWITISPNWQPVHLSCSPRAHSLLIINFNLLSAIKSDDPECLSQIAPAIFQKIWEKVLRYWWRKYDKINFQIYAKNIFMVSNFLLKNKKAKYFREKLKHIFNHMIQMIRLKIKVPRPFLSWILDP